MIVSFDFGISNTDVATSEKQTTEFYTAPSIHQPISIELLKVILDHHEIQKDSITAIGVTGGKSSDLPNSMGDIPIIKVNEVDAIGLGAKSLYGIQEASTLIVSAGTGTACVQALDEQFNHLGGIAVGGGMLEGLGHLLFKNSNGLEIDELASRGSKEQLDLVIGDVVNKIGSLAPEITAVNFGKAKHTTADTMENTSAALCNMIGEVIGTVAYLNALLIGSSNVCFIGRTAKLQGVINGINERLLLAGLEGQYAKNLEYANVIGVLQYLQKQL